jgi:NAD+ synthase
MSKNTSIEPTEAIEHIVNWLRTYAQNANMNGFVVGISGGVDSAVTSALCAKTGLDVLCVEMPIHQAPSHVSRAQEHIANLKQQYKNVNSERANLTPVFESFRTAVPSFSDEAILNLSLANTRARLRMTTLYYFAGLHRLLVAGTGNKVEDFGVGFYTKYGDGGVDLSPIADLMKSEVFLLGKHLGVTDSILNAKPTDGLFGDDRSDEDQLGASYDEFEWAMRQHEAGANSDMFEGREKEAFDIYIRLHKANQHKMQPIPVCILPR